MPQFKTVKEQHSEIIRQADEQMDTSQKEVENKWTWKRCIAEMSEEGAKYLVGNGKLPKGLDFKQLSTQQSMFNIRQIVYQDICKYINSLSKSIIHVHPTYRAGNPDDIVFIVITKKNENISLLNIEYPVEYRCVDEYSREGIDVTAYQQKEKIYFSDEKTIIQLRECLQKHTKHLMEEHSNITVISASPVKSKKYGTRSHIFSREICISLYVHIKGFVPINEMLFPEILDNIPVDVREGGFEFFGPKDRQEQLKMGCEIGGNAIGTLGAFVDFQNNTCCLTSAHVLLKVDDFKTLISKGSMECNITNGPEVNQPPSPGENRSNCFGNVIRAVYRPGGGDKAGVEVAVVVVHDRLPTSGVFPDEIGIADTASQLAFNSGKICYSNHFPTGTEVIMFGSETGFTKGYFNGHGTAIRKENFSSIFGCNIPLHNQLEIRSEDGKEFAKPGDSGALVLVPFRGYTTDLRAFGIFEGQTTDGKYIVTPIWDILESLGHPQLKQFQRTIIEEMKDVINERITQLEQKLQL